MGEIEKATQAWEQVASNSSSEVFTKHTKSRIEWLASDDAKSFYGWFSKFKPEPKPQLNLPSDLNSLPGLPDMKMPELPPFTPPATTPPATTPPAAPASDTPAATPPAAETPAAPAAETPAAPPTETPAAETPAPAAEAPATPATTPADGSGGSN